MLNFLLNNHCYDSKNPISRSFRFFISHTFIVSNGKTHQLEHYTQFFRKNPLLSLLERCKSLAQLKQIQCQMVSTGFIDIPFAASRLVVFCALSESKSLEYCTKILYHIREPNVFSWNVTIRGYVESGKSEGAIFLYMKMLRYGKLKPDSHTYPLLLKACSCQSLNGVGFGIFGHVLKFGFEFDIFVHNASITVLISFGELGMAYDVFDKSCVRDLVTWNSMINGCVRRGLANDALKLYRQMETEKVKPNEITMIGIISSCSQLQDLNLGREFLRYIEEHGLKLTIPLINNVLMDMYVKCGDLLAARVLFDNMEEKTFVSWTTMVLGLLAINFDKALSGYLMRLISHDSSLMLSYGDLEITSYIQARLIFDKRRSSTSEAEKGFDKLGV